MPVTIRCQCGKRLRGSDHFSGKRAKCPACGQVVIFPNNHTEPAAQASVPKGRETATRAASPDAPTGRVGRAKPPASTPRADRSATTALRQQAAQRASTGHGNENKIPLPTWASSTRGEPTFAEQALGAALRAGRWVLAGAGLVLVCCSAPSLTLGLGILPQGGTSIPVVVLLALATVVGLALLFCARWWTASLMPACTLNDLGASLASAGKIDNACFFLERAVAKDPGLFAAHFNRALCFLDTDHRAEALRDLDRTIELDPGSASAYRFRARIKQQEGDFSGAEMDLIRALQITRAAKRYDAELEQAAREGNSKEYVELTNRIPLDWLTPSALGGYLVAVKSKLVDEELVEQELERCRKELPPEEMTPSARPPGVLDLANVCKCVATEHEGAFCAACGNVYYGLVKQCEECHSPTEPIKWYRRVLFERFAFIGTLSGIVTIIATVQAPNAALVVLPMSLLLLFSCYVTVHVLQGLDAFRAFTERFTADHVSPDGLRPFYWWKYLREWAYVLGIVVALAFVLGILALMAATAGLLF